MKYSKKSKASVKPTDTPPRLEDLLADDLLAEIGTRPIREYQFTTEREWRFDLAFPVDSLAIEVCGRYHLSHKRFRQDCERNNYAILQGWTVLNYPASSVRAKSRRRLIVEQICRHLCGVSDSTLDSEVLTAPLR